MMDNTLIFEIIIAVIGILGGSGGLFVFLTTRQHNKTEDRASTVNEWQELYTEMKGRLEAQEQVNDDLKQQISELKSQLKALTLELETYKKYDSYLNKVESYANTLLNALKSLVSEDVYKQLLEKRPFRDFTVSDKKSNK